MQVLRYSLFKQSRLVVFICAHFLLQNLWVSDQTCTPKTQRTLLSRTVVPKYVSVNVSKQTSIRSHIVYLCLFLAIVLFHWLVLNSSQCSLHCQKSIIPHCGVVITANITIPTCDLVAGNICYAARVPKPIQQALFRLMDSWFFKLYCIFRFGSVWHISTNQALYHTVSSKKVNILKQIILLILQINYKISQKLLIFWVS